MSIKKTKEEKEIKLTKDLRNKLQEFTDRCDYYRNSYFFTPPRIPIQRRLKEEEDSIELFEFSVNDIFYSIEFTVEMSCHNVYAKSSIYKNGKKTNLRVIKTLLDKDKGPTEN